MAEFELLSIVKTNEYVAPVVDELLHPRGFISPKPLFWVCSADSPIRRVFEYSQTKGGTLIPRWGYSLDFVPHLSAGKLKWHRTEKSALLDIFVDGQGPKLNLTYMWGVTGLLDQMREKISAAVADATQFWAKGHSPSQLLATIEEIRLKPVSRCYVQLPLAAAICFAYCGRKSEGSRELEEFIQRHDVSSETATKLWQIFNAKLETAGKGTTS
jgi:hypothetical protein